MKHLDRITEAGKVQERIDALNRVINNPIFSSESTKEQAVFKHMLTEYQLRLKYLDGAKEYMVHFVSGGWNTCYGIDQRDAFDNALLEYPGDDGYCVVQNVTLASKSGIEAAMRNFY